MVISLNFTLKIVINIQCDHKPFVGEKKPDVIWSFMKTLIEWDLARFEFYVTIHRQSPRRSIPTGPFGLLCVSYATLFLYKYYLILYTYSYSEYARASNCAVHGTYYIQTSVRFHKYALYFFCGFHTNIAKCYFSISWYVFVQIILSLLLPFELTLSLSLSLCLSFCLSTFMLF